MHVIEATTIMKNEPPVGRTDVSECLPGWINTMCNAHERGEGYTLSHSAVSALAHTLICARVRAERLVRERDERVAVQLECEDQLPQFDGALFSAMYDASIVNGVRQYPFVTVNDERFYLVKVTE
jgi:hypothetical protein